MGSGLNSRNSKFGYAVVKSHISEAHRRFNAANSSFFLATTQLKLLGVLNANCSPVLFEKSQLSKRNLLTPHKRNVFN